jgi:uncharacterized metal-binding protein (TIGR02443 family)
MTGRKEPNPCKDDPKRFSWKFVWGMTCPACRGHDVAVWWKDQTLSQSEPRRYRCLQCAHLFETKLPQKLSQIGGKAK